MAETEEINTETLQSSFPAGRVKRIMKLDTEINKVNSDALFVISNATDLFLKFLTEKSSEVAIEKKRKTIKLEHLRMAVNRHRPTADFLLDSLPMPPPVQISSKKTDRSHKSDEKKKNSVPAGTRGIDSFFKKCE
ncbi:putative transcription factor Hap3/NF-YB family [Helianthus debilis subsp. tardiflorus]